MQIFEFGNGSADIVLIQLIGEHDAPYMEKIFNGIQKNTAREIHMIFARVDDWNLELSPWEAPAVFGEDHFRGGAQKTLETVKQLCAEPDKHYYIGGYSLAALFALWAAYQCDTFDGVASASPSIWFPGFIDYMKNHEINSRSVYLSLGDREEKTRNPVLKTVGDCIRTACDVLKQQNIDTILEWNKGNHFQNADKRVVAAFTKVIETCSK